MSRRAPWVTVALLLALGSCSDGAGTAAVVSFDSSACKKSTTSAALARLWSLKAIADEAGLDGLRCVAWQRTDAGLSLDLYNFDGACGATWVGDAALAADGTLEVGVDNPSCTIAACGSCMYDWSFALSVKLPNQAVPLAVTVSACPGQQQSARLTATIGPEASGISCTQATYGALAWQASARGTCGKASMPCSGSLLCGSGSASTTGTCAEGLVCESSPSNEPICRVPCATAADCPRPDVYVCDSGLCKPSGTGW